MFQNINISSLIKKKPVIFLTIKDFSNLKCFKEIFKETFSNNNKLEFTFLDNFALTEFYDSASKLVQYGWKKEAVPVIQKKKSIITRFFESIFG